MSFKSWLLVLGLITLGLVSYVLAQQFPTMQIDNVKNCLILGTDVDGNVECKSSAAVEGNILLESADDVLLESGDSIDIESAE